MEIPKLNIEEQELLWKAICDYSWYKTLAVNLRYYPSNRVENRPTPIGMLDMWGHKVRLFADIPYDPFTEIRLFLRPLTSMTEEEKNELRNILWFGYPSDDNDRYSHRGVEVKQCLYDDEKHSTYNFDGFIVLQNFLLKNHFDYHGLIPTGLALEAPEDIYKIK